MKTLLLISCLAFAGCTSLKQDATSKFTDPKTGIVTEHSVHVGIRTSGNGKQAVEALKASAGKTASVGLASADQEQNWTDIIKAAGAVLINMQQAAAETAAKAALAGAVPTTLGK